MPDSNPPPGFYMPNTDFLRPTAPSAIINPEHHEADPQKDKEKTPGAGTYDPHKPFGSDLNEIDFGKSK